MAKASPYKAGLRLSSAFVVALMAGSAGAVVGPEEYTAPELSPYTAMIKNGNGLCSASVLAPNIVLTAAHCVTNNPQVFYSRGERVFVEVAETAIRPSLDLALLRLKEPLPSIFKPLQISEKPVRIGDVLKIAGFGMGDENKRGTTGVLRKAFLSVNEFKPPAFVDLIDPQQSGFGGCAGDSGASVLTVDKDETPRLAAVAIQARGYNGLSCGASTLGLPVGPQMPWIRDTLQGWGVTLPSPTS